MSPPPATRPPISLPGLMLQFLTIGAIGFGGGMAVIALMERELIQKRRLLSTEEFLHGVGFGQLLGPFAVNAAFFIGCRLYCPWGGLLCAAAFVAPSVSLVIGFSWLYFTFHNIPSLQAAVQGVGPVVIALILAAAWSMGVKSIRGASSAVLAVLALAASLLKINAVWVLAAAGATGLVLKRKALAGPRPVPPPTVKSEARFAALPAPAVFALGAGGGGVSLGTLFWTFLQTGLVFFGGGFVLVPILHQQMVERLHWLTGREFLDGVAISNLTPGPIAVLATFTGYHLHGVAGALIATAALFLPAMVLMTVLSQGYQRFRGNEQFQDFLAGVTPAVTGLVVAAAILLGPSALHRPPDWIVAALSLVALTRFKFHPVVPLAVGAGMGALGWA